MIIKSKKAFWKNYMTIFTRMLLSSIGVRPMDTLNKDSETMTHFTLNNVHTSNKDGETNVEL